jgi:hypothetical protein
VRGGRPVAAAEIAELCIGKISWVFDIEDRVFNGAFGNPPIRDIPSNSRVVPR